MVLALVLLLASLADLARAPARATELSLMVAEPINIREGGETALTISVEPRSAIPEGSYLTIASANLPFTLSAGSGAGNTWLVELHELSGLKIRAPKGANGSGKLYFLLFASNGSVLAFAMHGFTAEAAAASGAAAPVSDKLQAEVAQAKVASSETKAVAAPPVALATEAVGQVAPVLPVAPEKPGLADGSTGVAPQPAVQQSQPAPSQERDAASDAAPVGESKRAQQQPEPQPSAPPVIAHAPRHAASPGEQPRHEVVPTPPSTTVVVTETAAAQPAIGVSSEAKSVMPQPAVQQGQPAPSQERDAASGAAPVGESKRAQQQPEPQPTASPVVAHVPGHADSPAEKPRLEVVPSPPSATVAAAAHGTAGVPSDAEARSSRLVEQGERQIAQGNVVVARQYFLRAAETGSAMGALKLAETYDPHMHVSLRLFGLKSEPKEAQRWYRRAAELGAPEAAERLMRLNR